MANHDQLDPLRWIWRGLATLAVVLGWLFIAWQNNFNVSPPLVFVCIAYFALVLTIYNLWRTGAAAVSVNDEDDGDSTWGKPLGALGELEREKRTLLKAIKEAEFDHQMDKLSKADADEMILVYRTRAIEVIKEIEKLEKLGGRLGTKREQIEREVRARLEVETKPARKAEAAVAGQKKAKGKAAKPAEAARPAEAAPPAEVAPPAEAVTPDDPTSDTSMPATTTDPKSETEEVST